MRAIQVLRWVLSLSLLMAPASEAATYYVNKSGSNGNSCATAQSDGASAKLTIGAGLGCLSAAGDVLIVGNGTYVEGALSATTSGTAGNPVIIRAANRHQAILSSTSNCSPGLGISASYVRVQAMRFTVDATNTPCGTPGTSSNVHVRCWDTQTPHIGGPATTGTVGCELLDNLMDDHAQRAIGLKINQDDALVESNQVSSIDAVDVNNLVIRYNTVVTCVPGSTCEATQNWCIVVKAGSRNTQIYRNTCRINGANEVSGGILVGGGSGSPSVWDDADQIDCYNCAAWSNLIECVTGFCPNALGFMDARNSLLFGNTVWHGALAAYTSNVTTDSPTVLNNIFHGGNLGACNPNWAVTGTVTIDYNTFYQCTTPPTQTHAINSDPLFVNAPTDMHLQAGSPAINAGTTQTSLNAYPSGTQACCSTDYAGTSRGAVYELGAYSYGTTAATGGTFRRRRR